MKTIDEQFICSFILETEKVWHNKQISPGTFGFQFQRWTRWLPGLSSAQIKEFESILGFSFPAQLRLLLKSANGTDLPTINVYGNSGEAHRTSVGVYSYPRDLGLVEGRIQDLNAEWKAINEILLDAGFDANRVRFLPFYIHRYIVCSEEFPNCPVLSIYGADAIVYADNLRDYLEMEFLAGGTWVSSLNGAKITLIDRSKSLQDLEGWAWGEPNFNSHVVTECHRLRRVPLNEWRIADLSLVIGQQISLEYLVPIALERLCANPMVEGAYSPGDLLCAVLSVGGEFWTQFPTLRDEVLRIAALIEAPISQDEALRLAYDQFKRRLGRD